MKTILVLFGCFMYAPVPCQVSIQYATPQDSLVFRKLEAGLRALPRLPKIDFRISDRPADTTGIGMYASLFPNVIDTSLMKDDPQLIKQNMTGDSTQMQRLRAFTFTSLVGIHRALFCIQDSVLFIMKGSALEKVNAAASAGGLTETDYVAGFRYQDFYYARVIIRTSREAKKIVLMSPILQFEKDSPERTEAFMKFIAPYLELCYPKLSEEE